MTQPDQMGVAQQRAVACAYSGTRAPVLGPACHSYNPYYDGPLHGGVPAPDRSAVAQPAAAPRPAPRDRIAAIRRRDLVD